KKSALLAEASRVIQGWQTDLLLGTISESDKTKLIEWRAYIKALEAIKPAKAPDIIWPERPAMPE
ncbi:tail fiber assembly protein, partial [Citrobacter portucalensis]